jgi:hypothetical protein
MLIIGKDRDLIARKLPVASAAVGRNCSFAVTR